MSGAPTPLLTALLIDGELVQGLGFAEPILNPATGEVLTQIAEASTEQVEAAILAAHRAFAGLVADHAAATLEYSAGHCRCHRKTSRLPRPPGIAELRQAVTPGAPG